MTNTTKIILLAGAGLAVWYVPTILAVWYMDISIISALPTGVNGNKFDFVVTVQLKNNSAFRVDMQSIKADILLNGFKVAQFNQVEQFPILAHSVQNINVNFTLDAETVSSEVLKQLQAQNMQNFILDVKGFVVANNKSLPFDCVWTMKDFIQTNNI